MRFTAGFWIAPVGLTEYVGKLAQSLKSPSIRIKGDGPFGEGDSILARIGTMSRSATTAAMPIRERDQCGWTGIRSPGRPRAPFVKPFPLTRPFVAPFPNVRPFTAPVVRPFTRPSRSPFTRPFVRPLVRPFVRPFVRPPRVPFTCPFTRPFTRPVPAGPDVVKPLERKPDTAA